MAASNYSVNIKLNTKPARNQLEALERRVNRLRTNLNKPLRVETKALTIQRQQAQLQDKRYATMRVTARLGTQVRKLDEKGLKVDKLRLDINKASKHLDKGRIESARAINKSVADELKGLEKRVQGETKLAGVDRQRLRDLNLIIGKKRVELSLIRTAGKFAAFNDRQRKGIGPNNLLALPSTEALKPGSRGISMLDRDARNLSTGFSAARYGPQPLKGSVAAGTTGFSAAQYGPQMLPMGRALSTGVGSPVFGKTNQIGSAANIAAILNDPTTSVSPVQKALEKMEARTKSDQKQAELNRKKSLSLGKDIVRIKVKEGKATAKNLQLESKQVAKQAQRLKMSPQGDFSRLSDRQSRNREGGRTFMNNPLSRAGLMPTQGFDTQSALISGAFPLLFGQGPVGAIAGGLGGGIGGMFGQMGGFAGGIAATAVVQQIQGALKGIADLGSALSPLTADAAAVASSLGLTGTALGQQLDIYTQVASKTDALNEVTRQMALLIGDDGVAAIKQFGESSTRLKNDFDRAMLGMQVAVAKVALFIGNRFKIFDKEGTRALSDRARVTFRGGEDLEMNKIKAEMQTVSRAPLDFEKGVTVRGKTFTGEAFKGRAIEFLREELVKRQKILDLQDAGLVTQKNVKRISENQLENLTEESLVLQDTINGGEVKADIEARVRALTKEVLGDQEKLTATQITQIEKQRKIITNTVTNNNKLKETVDIANKVADAFDKLKDTIAIDIGDGIKGLIKGTQSLNDVLRNVVDKLADAALNMAIFGNVGGGSVTGGLLGMFKADGGPVKGGNPYIVGERGPELFTPGVSGMITPNHALGGSTNVVVNVDASGSSVEGDGEKGRELGQMLSAAIQSELIKQKRPGGLLT